MELSKPYVVLFMDYLGMTIDFSQKGKVIIDMIDYLTKTCDEFPVQLEQLSKVPSAAPVDLFSKGDTTPLDTKTSEIFHTYVAKILFACKRARPDMQTATAVLCTRVQGPNQDDWDKLCQALKFILQTLNDKLILTVDDLKVVWWWGRCRLCCASRLSFPHWCCDELW